MIFALVKNNIVVNTIVADQTFADAISNQYDHVIRIDNLETIPSINWSYVDGLFVAPEEV